MMLAPHIPFIYEYQLLFSTLVEKLYSYGIYKCVTRKKTAACNAEKKHQNKKHLWFLIKKQTDKKMPVRMKVQCDSISCARPPGRAQRSQVKEPADRQLTATARHS